MNSARRSKQQYTVVAEGVAGRAEPDGRGGWSAYGHSLERQKGTRHSKLVMWTLEEMKTRNDGTE